MKTSAILKKLRTYLVENGWKKGPTPYPGGKEPRCLANALGEVAPQYQYGKSFEYLSDLMPQMGRNCSMQITTYNDHKSTTFEDILTILDFAIVISQYDERNPE